MKQPIIGFAGMTHLGLVSSVAAAEKGFKLICFDPDAQRIEAITQGMLPVSEPQLDELAEQNASRLKFTAESADLRQCDVIYVAPDVATDDQGQSDLAQINELLDSVFEVAHIDAAIVVLSQVPPGFTRGRQRAGRILFYQVETLVFGRAVERALYPERYIIGCADPGQALPAAYRAFLAVHDCPLLPMRYESAELAKISINMCLVSSVSTANTLAELCEKIGADWAEIVPALKLDRRIGPHAYLAPGLGISGGNLERDLITACTLADKHGTDASIVRAWLANSQRRKGWAANTLREVLLSKVEKPVIAVWGLAYKENTHSTKNSPSIAALLQLPDTRVRIFDPVVAWNSDWHKDACICTDALDAINGADALMILTPWPEFKSFSVADIAQRMRGQLVLDPYAMLSTQAVTLAGLVLYTLGSRTEFEIKQQLAETR
ncbi:nucleotide sugar dehydrogenase [Burkholderiaceae bacterium]|nr:nucleotide sugar dehydrogenase [Burkholderiaceae bacterium]